MAIRRISRALAVILGCVLLAFFSGPIRGDGNQRALDLSIAPGQGTSDPGPAQLVGVETNPKGTHFVWADLYLEGAGDCRVYFDYRDKSNYHFFDRRDAEIVIGLCEAGVEQIYGKAAIAVNLPVRIARHGPHISTYQDGQLLLTAFDDRLQGGSVGHRMLTEGKAITLKVEPRDDVHFTDDFMIREKKAAQWRGNGDAERGDFTVRSLKNPLLSANAFNYMGAGRSVYSVVGEPWWDNYRYEISLRGPVAGTIGLVFAYQDEKNYGLFRWTARHKDGEIDVPGKREIVRVRHGQEEVLMQSAGGYAPDQWYNAVIRVSDARTTVTVDGHLLAEAADRFLTCGGAGVWCDVPIPATVAADPKSQSFHYNSLHDLMKQHAVFDDVLISTNDGFEDDFKVPGPLAAGWLVGTGSWTVVKAKAGAHSGGSLEITPGTGTAKALIGDRRWAQYDTQVAVKPGGGAAGLIFLHRDESNYYSVVVDGDQMKLIRVANGVESVADKVPLSKSASAAPIVIKARIRHGHVKATADDGSSVETFDSGGLLRGRAGLVAYPRAGQKAVCSDFRLSFLPEPEPLVTTNAIFEDETSMLDWTSPTSEWYPPRDPLIIDGRPVNLLWHRGQFPGDMELTIEPREIPEPKFEVALSCAKDGQGKNNGYVFRYKSGEASEGGSRSTILQIFRAGEKVQERTVKDDVRELSSVTLRRCGKYVVGIVNGQPAISYRDDQPLSGAKLAFYTQGLVVRTEATKIVSDNFRNELFSSAPTGWRTSGPTVAEVTNRWQCDPRWSFFCLKNDRPKGKPAVLWSKNLYPGNVTVEFYVGYRMEGERGQPYHYARDLNVTLCSDGQDLTKGYTFMFGGFNNTGSMILRNGVEVKRNPRTAPTDMNYHRHWFAIRVEKRGNTVAFRVDRFFAGEKEGELVYEDEQPLKGDHLAIWTYDMALMLSRVRISGEGGGAMENPDWIPGPLKTPYDGK